MERILMPDWITFPRIIPIISMLGVYHVWMKNKRGFIYHSVAAVCWCGYDLSIGAKEQGIYVFKQIS